MCTTRIDAVTFSELVKAGMYNLDINKETVNDLNVFPIPDGDTGDNMTMTMTGGASVQVTEEMTISEAAEKISKAMLLSARGNSGVILSQLMAGIAKGIKGVEEACPSDIITALNEGVKQAYKSVMTPTEGTMLTVSREATEATSTKKFEDFETLLSHFIEEAKASLDRTPSLLPVLKEAGVVDSGGAGLIYILEGMQLYIMGELDLSADTASIKVMNTEKPSNDEPDYELFTEDSELEFGYCTEILLRLQNSKTSVEEFDENVFKDELMKLGDSIVCIKSGSAVKIHIHTMEPYKVLEYCQKYGEYLKVKIENMMIQHSTRESNNAAPEKMHKAEHKRYGVVCVANGVGIKNDFISFGADEVIVGGQTMNPSAEDFIDAFERVNADDIFVLPNNGNVILAARQAGSVYEKANIHVIPTHTIGDAYAILPMMDFSSEDAKDIEEQMLGNMEGVLTAEVSKSIRDASMNGVNVKKDDFIGIFGKEIVASNVTLLEASKETLDKMELSDKGMLIIIRGKEATDEQTESLMAYLKEKYPYLEVSRSDGLQDIYPFYFIAA